MFPHKRIHKGTQVSPNGQHINQIDHVPVNTRFSNSNLDVRTVRGADTSRYSDHFLVISKLRMVLKEKRKGESNKGKIERFDVAKLKNPSGASDFLNSLNFQFISRGREILNGIKIRIQKHVSKLEQQGSGSNMEGHKKDYSRNHGKNNRETEKNKKKLV